MSKLLLVLVFLSFVACAAVADTIHVPGEEPTIQAGIVAAKAGDTVLVACNTYYEHNITMKSGVYLTSETGLADCVTIDAQQQGRVFICQYVDDQASIVGFTITGGLTAGDYPDDSGGGMFYESSFMSLTECAFVGNQADYGGGLYVGFSISPTITSCTFEENQADNGGGACFWNSFGTLTSCTFVGNEAVSGGGVHCCHVAGPTFTDCTFEGNVSVSGGGMYCFSSSSPLVLGCTFVHNEGSWLGGGILCSSSSTPTLTRCIIAFSEQGEAVYCFDEEATPVLSCCDIYDNAGGDWVGHIASQLTIDGNFSEDPLFCDRDNSDFTLYAASPCAAENSYPSCDLIGAWDVGCDSPVEKASWGTIKAMYR